MNVIVVGGGAAGTIAALVSKQMGANVTIIRKDKEFFVKCSSPYVISGDVEYEKATKPDTMITSNGIRLILDEVTDINVEKKTVKTSNGLDLFYDKLILATGATPFVPPIKIVSNRVFKLHDGEDVKKISKVAENANSVTVIGGGAIGIEIASEFKKMGKNVRIIELLDHLMERVYDKEFCDKIESTLTENGIILNTSTKVQEINDNKIITDKGTFESDLIIMSIGVRAEVDLAKKIGLKIDKGIIVNDKMETSIKDIYAAGDCAEYVSMIDGKFVPSQIATTAVLEGKVAAMNACGRDISLNGLTNPITSEVFNTSLGRVGFNELDCKKSGIEYIIGKAKSMNKYDSEKDAKPLEVKILFEKKSKLVIGAEMIGANIAERIDLISLAIQKKSTLFDMIKMNYCAHPKLTPLPFMEPIVMAAEDALTKI